MRPQALDRLYRMFFISPDVLTPLDPLNPISTNPSATKMTFSLGDDLMADGPFRLGAIF